MKKYYKISTLVLTVFLISGVMPLAFALPAPKPSLPELPAAPEPAPAPMPSPKPEPMPTPKPSPLPNPEKPSAPATPDSVPEPYVDDVPGSTQHELPPKTSIEDLMRE